jgi:signal transduction histidine kinase
MYRVKQLKKIISLRTNISRDLHDEIGSTLSGISIIGQMAKQNLQTKKTNDAENLLDKIVGSSTEMLTKMSDIVWAINPINDSFQQIVSRLKNYTQASATPMGVVLNFKVEKDLEQYNLDMQRRKNIYLICKEAINNSLKYSQCKNLTVQFNHQDHKFRISVRDDGKGFNIQNEINGNGLKNMQARADEIHAKLIIDSKKNEGTVVELFV